MNGKNQYMPNYLLYFILIGLSLFFIIAPYMLQLGSEAVSIISSIGCGCFSSVVVGLLIDISKCRDNRKEAVKLKKMYFYNFVTIYSWLLQKLAFLVDDQTEKHTWDEWAMQIAIKCSDADIRAIEQSIKFIETEVERIQKQKLFLLSQNLIPYSEFMTLSELVSSLHFFVTDMKMGLKDKVSIQMRLSMWQDCTKKSVLLNRFNEIRYNSILELTEVTMDFLGSKT